MLYCDIWLVHDFRTSTSNFDVKRYLDFEQNVFTNWTENSANSYHYLVKYFDFQVAKANILWTRILSK